MELPQDVLRLIRKEYAGPEFELTGLSAYRSAALAALVCKDWCQFHTAHFSLHHLKYFTNKPYVGLVKEIWFYNLREPVLSYIFDWLDAAALKCPNQPLKVHIVTYALEYTLEWTKQLLAELSQRIVAKIYSCVHSLELHVWSENYIDTFVDFFCPLFPNVTVVDIVTPDKTTYAPTRRKRAVCSTDDANTSDALPPAKRQKLE